MQTVQLLKSTILQGAPSTRYQGSKRRFLPWIHRSIRSVKFESVLDAFGGTASVSFLFKLMGKRVFFNDVLLSNYLTGIALIENHSITLDIDDIGFLLHHNGFDYPTFVQDTFEGIYYLREENQWLDMISLNIEKLSDKYYGDILKRKQALAYHILCQACLCKRPFNLFHRQNLYLRTSSVKRTFGNKQTWDTPFDRLFNRFSSEISKKVFDNGKPNAATCTDIMEQGNLDLNVDLVYLDPPYTRKNAERPKDYRSLYHFLEGLVDYQNWERKIDWNTTNRGLLKESTGWEAVPPWKAFDSLFHTFKDSVIVVSYGDPGTPSIEKISELLLQYKSTIRISRSKSSYALRGKGSVPMSEVLMIAS